MLLEHLILLKDRMLDDKVPGPQLTVELGPPTSLLWTLEGLSQLPLNPFLPSRRPEALAHLVRLPVRSSLSPLIPELCEEGTEWSSVSPVLPHLK